MSDHDKIDLDGDILSCPAVNAEPASLDDATDFTMQTFRGGIQFPRAFICGVTASTEGVLSIINGNGTQVEIPVIRGVIYPIVAKRYRTSDSLNITSVVALG